jgi:putative transposase
MRRFSPRRRLTGLAVPGVTTAPEAVRRDSHPTEPNRLWLADVAVGNAGGGPLYLAAILDCYSRHCVGWWIDRHLSSGLVVRSVEQAALRRRSSLVPGHAFADRGDDVTLAVTSRCETAGIAVPPGASPTAFDGAVAESFFSMLRQELSAAPAWGTRSAAAEAIADWIEGCYNARRRAPLHSYVA